MLLSLSVLTQEESEAISLELESGEVIDANQVLELGDCYCGLVMVSSDAHDLY